MSDVNFKKCKNKSISITQEIEFSRKVESVAIWHKRVVSLVLWFDLINSQFVVPKKVKNVSVQLMVSWDISSILMQV